MQSGDNQTLVNFGGNQKVKALHYRPRNEQEVLDILAKHRAERVRAVGSLHSWSDIAVARDVVLDLGELSFVEPLANGSVRAGAGSRLQDILDRLHAATDRTLPTLGVIAKQTIAGAISTATHGTGRQSLSHYVQSVRIAGYDAAGAPRILEFRDGDGLRAARCGLGAMGVILSVEMATVPKYRIRDTVRCLERAADVLALYERYPLTQFALTPYGWKFIVFEREAVPGAGEGEGAGRAAVFRGLNIVGVDFLLHVMVKASIALGKGAVTVLMKVLHRLLIMNVPRIDASTRVLRMEHHLFRHEEMEVFVPGSRLAEALGLLKSVVEIHAGNAAAVSSGLEATLRATGLYDELMAARGHYVHHYPIFCRRVLPDDTLVSMTASSDEPWFSISFFNYHPASGRSAYYRLCSWVARALHALYGARLHWGKHYPLGAAETARMYPNLERFREICRASDPNGVFRNDFTDRVLQLR